MASIKSANTNQYTVHFGGLDATLPPHNPRTLTTRSWRFPAFLGLRCDRCDRWTLGNLQAGGIAPKGHSLRENDDKPLKKNVRVLYFQTNPHENTWNMLKLETTNRIDWVSFLQICQLANGCINAESMHTTNVQQSIWTCSLVSGL